MGVQHIQQCFGNFRKFVVELVMDASAKQRKGFDQSFNVRIIGDTVIKNQTSGDFRILLRELTRHLSNERELSFVIGEQLVSHNTAPSTEMRRESRCKVASNNIVC